MKTSDWYIPKDWAFWLGWHFVTFTFLLLPILFNSIINMLFSGLTETQNGNPNLYYLSLSLALSGILLLLIARIPLYRQKKFFVIGPKGLPSLNKLCYWISYCFIVPAVVLMALLFWVLKG
jgi:hypothetical protein